MADDGLKGESKEFDLDVRKEGALIVFKPGNNDGQVKVNVFADTFGPCGTPNPPPTHIVLQNDDKVVDVSF